MWSTLVVCTYVLYVTRRPPAPNVHHVEHPSVIEQSKLIYSIGILEPGKPGRCWFHSQKPHYQDREIFKRLGGKVNVCAPATVFETTYTSEAEICECIAPPAQAFSKNFLEIGAADGQYLSNLLFFEMQMNWKGICIEGSPSTFQLLRVNRPKCINLNAVIGSEQGKKLFYTFHSPNSWEIGMSCMQGTACGKRDEDAEAYAEANQLTLIKEYVEMRRLSDIFQMYGFKSFGWLMIDVEGAEDMVVPTINFDLVAADFVSYEGTHKTAHEHISNSGYIESFTVGLDTFFVPRI